MKIKGILLITVVAGMSILGICASQRAERHYIKRPIRKIKQFEKIEVDSPPSGETHEFLYGYCNEDGCKKYYGKKNDEAYPFSEGNAHLKTFFQLPYADDHVIMHAFLDAEDRERYLRAVAFFDKNGQFLMTYDDVEKNRGKGSDMNKDIDERWGRVLEAMITPKGGVVCEKVAPVGSGRYKTHAIAIETSDINVCELIKKYYEDLQK